MKYVCKGGAYSGHLVSSELGERWPYVLNPFAGIRPEDRMLQWYVLDDCGLCAGLGCEFCEQAGRVYRAAEVETSSSGASSPS